MNIKTRLSIRFTLFVLVILFFFSTLAYYFSYSSQLAKFKEDLLDRAKNTAILLIDVEEVDSSLLKKIHESTISWEDEEIILTDSALLVIYSNNAQNLSAEILRMHAYQGEINYFSLGEKDGVCYRHVQKQQTNYVFILAYDRSRKEKLLDLRGILFWSILISVLLSVGFSYFFSKNAMHPITQIIRDIKIIDSSKLSQRLSEGNREDEIAQLAIAFNKLLTDLEIVFRNQEDFVSNASHELRTPLAVIVVETNYLLSKERKTEEYINHFSKLVEDLKKMNTLLNSLLELAQINRDHALLLTALRIDEIIYDAIDEIKTKHEGRKIVLKIQYPENEDDLIIQGNQGMLTMAMKNLIDNACKFSDMEVTIEFIITDNSIKINIIDKGIGIPPDEMKSIGRPFKRASNAKFIGGFGIGLSLVSKILELHHADMIIHSTRNEGTRFELVFKRVKPAAE